MKKITMKKSAFIAIIALVTVFSSSVGVIASNGVEKIQAALNHNIKFVVDGKSWTPKDSTGKSLSALVYNGSTYVPLRATGEALGAQINYDPSSLLITVNSGKNNSNEGIPYLDITDTPTNPPTTPVSSPNPSASSSTTSSGHGNLTTAKGTESDPVPLGQSFKYKDVYEDYSKANSYEAEYQLTIKKVTTVPASDYTQYRLQAEPGYDYVALTIKLDLLAGKMTKIEDTDGAYGSVYFYPNFVGTETSDTYTIFSLDYSFDGALNKMVDDAFNFKKFKVGEKASYSVEGIVIVGVEKNKSNSLTIRNTSLNYDDSKKVYFKIN